ncbi:hypothetical protein [Thioflexithrix psekupsensis]|uniref:Uncharacterized protein n=1 Tax=Thioflexithrix psekupsensis TaxID=1570016 RepID=A0A251X6L4_9GAMM|nr:hypothetical protein [Thioflexithrix psekupsensis]OUD12567.1 hypothetical protein TPSD3_15905 [Thioflexithrix psekupsensis]
MKTIREQIIERVMTQLESIHVDNGYHNIIGSGRVFRHEPMVARFQAPSAVVWELAEQRHRNRFGGTVRTLTIKVEAIVEVLDQEHPVAVSNMLLGDLERVLIIADTSLDELIDDIQDVAAYIDQTPLQRHLSLLNTDASHNAPSDVIQFPQQRAFAIAAIDFEITYTTEWGNPYLK